MAKRHLTLVSPATINRTVGPLRRPNAELRKHEHLFGLAAIVAQLRAAGVTSLRAIAAALDEPDIPTATGVGKWRAAQVWRMRARLPRRP